MKVCQDSLEELPSYQAMTSDGQPTCIHCLQERGSFERSEGRTPLLVYVRPCTHHPLGGLAAIWVDTSLVGQIDVQLLKQDTKKDTGTVVNACLLKQGERRRRGVYGDVKCQIVRDHVVIAMMLKYEQKRVARLLIKDDQNENTFHQ